MIVSSLETGGRHIKVVFEEGAGRGAAMGAAPCSTFGGGSGGSDSERSGCICVERGA